MLRTLNINNPDDAKLIDDFNLKLYKQYLKSNNSKLKDDKLLEFEVEHNQNGDIIRVQWKPKNSSEDDESNEAKASEASKTGGTYYCTYQLTSRKLKDGTVKQYVTRHKHKYQHRVPKISSGKRKYTYLDMISKGSIDKSSGAFIIPNIEEYNIADKSLLDYLANSTLDYNIKVQLQTLLNSDDAKITKIRGLESIMKDNNHIPVDYKFTDKQIRNYIYRHIPNKVVVK